MTHISKILSKEERRALLRPLPSDTNSQNVIPIKQSLSLDDQFKTILGLKDEKIQHLKTNMEYWKSRCNQMERLYNSKSG